MQCAQAIGFVASLKDNTGTKMGILHASYGALQMFQTNASAVNSGLIFI
jgi:hypothetical protein